MTISASIHNPTAAWAKDLGSSHANGVFELSTQDGGYISAFIPYDLAQALVAVWDEYYEEPEPLDAETITAREHAHDDALRQAGRGHLARP